MNKKFNYILCVAVSLLMFSCDKKEETKPESSENNSGSVKELIETNIDLSVNYYRSEEIYKNLSSNSVIGFYDNEMFYYDWIDQTDENICSYNRRILLYN